MWINLTGMTPDPVSIPALRRTNEERAARIYQGWRALRRALGELLQPRHDPAAPADAPQHDDAAGARTKGTLDAPADPAPARPTFRAAA